MSARSPDSLVSVEKEAGTLMAVSASSDLTLAGPDGVSRGSPERNVIGHFHAGQFFVETTCPFCPEVIRTPTKVKRNRRMLYCAHLGRMHRIVGLREKSLAADVMIRAERVFT